MTAEKLIHDVAVAIDRYGDEEMERMAEQHRKNAHAVALGRRGGKANTPAQQAARKRNARLGGWPKGRPRKPRPQA